MAGISRLILTQSQESTFPVLGIVLFLRALNVLVELEKQGTIGFNGTQYLAVH